MISAIENAAGKTLLGKLNLHRMTVLKCGLRKEGVVFGLPGTGCVPNSVEGSREHGNEYSSYVKFGEFHDHPILVLLCSF